MSLIRPIRICLFGLVGPALIVPFRSRVHYYNQTHGVCCLQSELEGFLVPVGDERFEAELESLFPGGHYGDIDQACGERIEELLNITPEMSGIQINWERFGDSHVAWLHVLLTSDADSCFEGLLRQPAVLTWNNGD